MRSAEMRNVTPPLCSPVIQHDYSRLVCSNKTKASLLIIDTLFGSGDKQTAAEHYSQPHVGVGVDLMLGSTRFSQRPIRTWLPYLPTYCTQNMRKLTEA